MRYLLLDRGIGLVTEELIRSRVEKAGGTVITWRGLIGQVEFDGTAAELTLRAGGLHGWLVSEQRVYRLAHPVSNSV